MKSNKMVIRIGSIVLLVLSSSCLNTSSDKKESIKEASIEFKNINHYFGKIHKFKSACATFKFSNKGKTPLIIKGVKTSCGCTVPEWTKESVAPNKEGVIKVSYNAKYFGNFQKTITVFYNGKNSPQQLTIKGEVIYQGTKEDSISK